MKPSFLDRLAPAVALMGALGCTRPAALDTQTSTMTTATIATETRAAIRHFSDEDRHLLCRHWDDRPVNFDESQIKYKAVDMLLDASRYHTPAGNAEMEGCERGERGGGEVLAEAAKYPIDLPAALILKAHQHNVSPLQAEEIFSKCEAQYLRDSIFYFEFLLDAELYKLPFEQVNTYEELMDTLSAYDIRACIKAEPPVSPEEAVLLLQKYPNQAGNFQSILEYRKHQIPAKVVDKSSFQVGNRTYYYTAEQILARKSQKGGNIEVPAVLPRGLSRR